MFDAERCQVSVRHQVTARPHLGQEARKHLPVSLGRLRRPHSRQGVQSFTCSAACRTLKGRSNTLGLVVMRTNADSDTQGKPTRMPLFRLSCSHTLAASCCAASL